MDTNVTPYTPFPNPMMQYALNSLNGTVSFSTKFLIELFITHHDTKLGEKLFPQVAESDISLCGNEIKMKELFSNSRFYWNRRITS
jgi:hypothetical protein